MTRPKAIKPVSTGDGYHRMMVYGEPGVGKTVFAGSSPKALILANDEAEVMSAAALGSKADVWSVSNFSELADAYEYLRHEGQDEYDWVWVDNVTLMQDQNMDHVMEALVAAKPSRNRWVPDQHEYLVNQNQLSTVVRDFKKLSMHVGFTAHQMKTEDDEGRVLYLPMIQGGQGMLAQKICGYMNIVGCMQVVRKEDGIHRKMIVEKRSKYLAKGRFPGMPGVLDDPTVPKLESAIAATVATPKQAKRPARKKTKQTTRKAT